MNPTDDQLIRYGRWLLKEKKGRLSCHFFKGAAGECLFFDECNANSDDYCLINSHIKMMNEWLEADKELQRNGNNEN